MGLTESHLHKLPVDMASGAMKLLINPGVDEQLQSALMTRRVSPAASSVQSQYSYPKLRFSILFRASVVLDCLVTVILWLTCGNMNYVVHSIKDYYLWNSLFDLVIISLVKIPLYAVIIGRLEQTTILMFDSQQAADACLICKVSHALLKRWKRIFTMLCVLSTVIFVFTLVKGMIILKRLILETDKTDCYNKNAYIACIVWSIVASLFCLANSGFSGLAMKKLQNQRMLKYYNRHGFEVDSDGKRLPKKATLYNLIALAKPETDLIVIGTVGLLFTLVGYAVSPLLVGHAVDSGYDSHFSSLMLILVTVHIVVALCKLLTSWLFSLAGQRFVCRLRKQLFLSIILQEQAFFDANRTGELFNHLLSDTQEIQQAVIINIPMLCYHGLQIITSITIMFYLNVSLTMGLVFFLPVLFLGILQYGKLVMKIRQILQDNLTNVHAIAEDILSSIKIVRSFNREAKAEEIYNSYFDESYKIWKKLAATQGFFAGLFHMMSTGMIITVLWYGGTLMIQNEDYQSTGITPGILISFLMYTGMILLSFAMLALLYEEFMKAVGVSVRLFSLLYRRPEVFVHPLSLIMSPMFEDIEFKNVSFTYPLRPKIPVLKNMSFKVEAGETVALVGASGSGKTTIVNLLERFYDPNVGIILVGGCDLTLLNLDWYRQNVAFVGQEPTLLAGTIKENIAYGREATLNEVIEVAKQTNIHQYVMKFEQGYETSIGERGLPLSGGLKQCIAIARALIMNPKILILDEAMNALDGELESQVLEAITNIMKGHTVLVVAQRLSTIRLAERIIVVNKGAIVETGSHRELLAKCGVYRKLVLKQLTVGEIVQKSSEETVRGFKWQTSVLDTEGSDVEDWNYNNKNVQIQKVLFYIEIIDLIV